MNQNVILELKQSEGFKVQSGEFINNIAKPITIYDQDQIILNKVFIDTEAETDAIIDIPFDLNIHTQQMLSINNDNLAKFNAYSDGGNNLDNVDYYIYEKKTAAFATANMLQINGLDVQPDDFNNRDIGDPDFPNNPIEFQYTDLLDQVRTVHLAFKQVKYRDVKPFITEFQFTLFIKQVANPETDQDLNLQIVQTAANIATCKKLNFPSKIGKDDSENNPMVFLFQPAGTVFNKSTLTPKLTDFNMVIPGGKYIADDLCTLITNRMSENAHARTFQIGDSILSPFLVNSADFSGANFTTVANFGEQGLALGDMRTATLNNNFFVGTNQIQLSYNSTSGKFFFNFMHFPVYTTSGIISTRLIEVSNNIFSQQTRNGTIAFTSMDATNNQTGEPFDFWDGLLGFNVAAMKVPFTHTLQFDDDTTIFIAELPKIVDAVNTTNAKVDLDSMVNKAGNVNYNYQRVVVQAGQANPAPFIENNFNTVVEARNVIVSEVSTLTIPYFLIEMNAGFKTNLVSTETTSSTIQGIVDRYYSKGSYTMGSDNSLIYTHRGQPLVLSKFYTRILQPNRKVPERLGDDNTIFLEIIRNNEFFLLKRQMEIQEEIEEQKNILKKS